MNEDQNIESSQEDRKTESPKEDLNEKISQQEPIEITKSLNPTSEISTSEIKNMEVHHHPNLHHRKKNWKEYFLEFLMIFLAVTLGFFAENYRENIVNHQNEHHYIEGLLADLTKDTSDIVGTISYQQFWLSKMENALKIPVEKIRRIPTQDSFYRNFVYFYAWLTWFIQNDNTFSQLKNAGGFSVIHKENVVDSISLFYIYYQGSVQNNTNWYIKAYEKTADLAAQLIRLPETPSNINDTTFAEIPNNREVFTRYDKPLLEQLFTLIRYQKGTLLFLIECERDYRMRATRLIQLLQKEYNLK